MFPEKYYQLNAVWQLSWNQVLVQHNTKIVGVQPLQINISFIAIVTSVTLEWHLVMAVALFTLYEASIKDMVGKCC